MNILYLQISICLEKKYIFSVHLPTYYDLFLFVCLFVLFSTEFLLFKKNHEQTGSEEMCLSILS